jgi:hypothetical protein
MAEERKKILEMLAAGKLSVDEAERLLEAVGGDEPSASPGPGAVAKSRCKYLRVLVEDGPKGEKVNVRVPLGLIRAGIKLGGLIPEGARGRVNEAMRAKGLDFDLDSLDAKTVEELMMAFSELKVDATSGAGESVRLFCE